MPVARDSRCTMHRRTAAVCTERIFGMEAARGRWILVLAGFLVNICLGGVYAYSVFRNSVQDLLQASATGSGLPFTVFLVFDTILMLFGGRLIDAHGPKNVGVIGGVLVGAGWILSGILPRVVPSIWTLVFTYGIVAGSGVGLTYGVPLAVANRWFPGKKGLAIGLTLAGFGGSPFITANVARPLIESNGPLYAFMAMGFAFLGVVVILSCMLKFPAPTLGPSSMQPGASPTTVNLGFAPRQMVKTPTFWGLLLVYTIGCLSGLMAIGIASPVGTDVIRIDASTAAAMVGFFALFNGAGRPLFGWLTDHISPRWTATFSMLIVFGASLLMLGATPSMASRYTWSFAALWLCLGGWLSIGPTATATFFGARHYAKNYSYVYLGYGVAAILSNAIAGSSLDLFGDYDTAFVITAVLAVVGAVVASVFMKPPRPVQAEGDSR